jgi:hypothetical protein
MLARLLAQAGTSKRAEAEARRAVFLDANRDPDVSTTLQQIRSGLL